MHKISLFDYARMGIRETSKKCKVAIGDLVKIDCLHDKRKTIIGIISVVDEKNMCIMIDSQLEWWSRYVNCTVL